MARLLPSLTAGVLVLGATIDAHHAISAIYDNSKPMTLRGTVTEFQFINPHPFVMMEVVDGGRAQTWQLEMDNRFELVAIGMTADSIKKGDHVVVTGGPARSRSNGLYVLRLDRESDGLRYEQIGASPRITRIR
jgi:Family of unknown function (DUF6152)